MSESPAGPIAPEKLFGQIEKISFYNPENGFAVIQLKIKGQFERVVAVGHLGQPIVGERLELTGHYSKHPKFGKRFEVETFENKPPDTAPALKRYLGSGLIPGVGPVLAGRMVDLFEDKILDVLDNEPERLTQVPGLGAVKREKIIEAWRSSFGLRRLLKFLTTFGLGPAIAQRVLRRLGPTAEELIKENPYRLAYDIEGVGFKSADRVALALGWAEDSPERLEAALLCALGDNVRQGHVFTPTNELIKDARALIPAATGQNLMVAIGRLALAARVKPLKGVEPGLQDIYPPKLFRAESWVAKELLAIKSAPPSVTVPRPQKALEWAEKTLELTLSPDQRQAVLAAIMEKAVVITGGPGTGKTTITKAITKIWQAVTPRIALCAPTGRAAKRLSQATGFVATTIHKLLEYSSQAGGFARGPNNHLDLDMLLIDESSMLDILIANQLLGALPSSCVLILVGDRDQLPPVGPGRVLGDILDSGVFPVCYLKTIYRQAKASLITQAAHLINQGQTPEKLPQGPEADFYFVPEDDVDKIINKILRLVTERAPLKLKIDPKADIQVLTPVRQGDLGTNTLNILLGQALNPTLGPTLSRFGQSYRVGDRVIQLRNNYQRDVFNGDLGLVTSVDPENQELTVEFDHVKSLYQLFELDEIWPAWALTVHKSQGSEFPVVVMPLFSGHWRMLRRKLLYTAVTRGRRLVVLVGSREALAKACSDANENLRRSNLAQFLRYGPPPLRYENDFYEIDLELD
ncbi:MAG: ATP-dependent RecD-like DNA helicase [Deltaproteobacteria bacterium]|nr:ATP-dependent RecD-like DNA helicase [Deltaproteobacteria bacterium]